jgi:hypothetical protein
VIAGDARLRVATTAIDPGMAWDCASAANPAPEVPKKIVRSMPQALAISAKARRSSAGVSKSRCPANQAMPKSPGTWARDRSPPLACNRPDRD